MFPLTAGNGNMTTTARVKEIFKNSVICGKSGLLRHYGHAEAEIDTFCSQNADFKARCRQKTRAEARLNALYMLSA